MLCFNDFWQNGFGNRRRELRKIHSAVGRRNRPQTAHCGWTDSETVSGRRHCEAALCSKRSENTPNSHKHAVKREDGMGEVKKQHPTPHSGAQSSRCTGTPHSAAATDGCITRSHTLPTRR